ncbi:hypothetical protein I3842_02G022700 [Carya illinoinensis]|uniref:ENTH domain-containing protein n=1 Tax=Carya illinoinensis TaxID=32201 RepID=A0A922FTE8_CARIL|nr:hypothetical protein I3842_02G022700 [Carya illinoinensis]
MGRTGSGKLRDILGLIKDKASQSKAALLSNPSTLSFHLSLLRATTHDPFSPPLHKHLSAILSFGHSSRATASSAIEVLMDRLQTTRDSCVALKCLFIVHLVLVRGDFILQDQLSIYPSTGGRNYLNLSNFRDNSSPLTWELSSWVRWYAQYIETLLSTSRVLGFFIASSSYSSEKDKQEEKITALMDKELLVEVVSLVGLIEEFCKRPDPLHVEGNKLVEEIMGFVCEDHFSAINEVSVRVSEFRERLGGLSFGESVELVCALTRLENCKERLYELSTRKRSVMDSFWCLIGEIKEGAGMEKDEGKLMIRVRSEKAGESARYGERVLIRSRDSVRFSSGRFPFHVPESIMANAMM